MTAWDDATRARLEERALHQEADAITLGRAGMERSAAERRQRADDIRAALARIAELERTGVPLDGITISWGEA